MNLQTSSNDLTGFTLASPCGCKAISGNEHGSHWRLVFCDGCSVEEAQYKAERTARRAVRTKQRVQRRKKKARRKR